MVQSHTGVGETCLLQVSLVSGQGIARGLLPRDLNISMAAVFLDIEKSFDSTWHPGSLYKLHKLKCSTNLIELVSSFLSERKFAFSFEGKMFTPKKYKQGASKFRPLPNIVQCAYK
jgi:hypothetical protein